MIDENNSDSKQPEELIQEIQVTKDSLAEKVSSLESGVRGTVDKAQKSVQETIEGVKDSVNLREHVRNHPWLSLAVSTLGGVLLGISTNENAQAIGARVRSNAKKHVTEKSSAVGNTVKAAVLAAGVRIIEEAAISSFKREKMGRAKAPETAPPHYNENKTIGRHRDMPLFSTAEADIVVDSM